MVLTSAVAHQTSDELHRELHRELHGELHDELRVDLRVDLQDDADRGADSPREQLDAALRALDPVDLRSPIIRRVDASGFVTEDILSRLLHRLQRYRVNAASTLVDLGCGSAGVSLWLAERTSARLHAVDADALSVGRASRRARDYRLAHAPTFDCAPFETTWIETSLAHAVISLDALHLATRPLAALLEAHRILASNGVLVFNVYVSDDDPGAASWVRTLESAGFAMLDIDDQTHVWRSIMTARHRARVEHGALLATRFGERLVAPELAISRTMLGLDYGPSLIANTRRVELLARKDSTLALRRLVRGSSNSLRGSSSSPRGSSSSLRPRPIDE